MSATDINDWPGHPDADPDCECCLGDGLQADGETPCPCIGARRRYRAAPESPDQYRREGAEAMGVAAADMIEEECSFMSQHGMAQAIRAIDVDDVLARLRPRCAECDEGILPCPFCGGLAEIVEIDEGENAGGSCVCCTKCFASGNVEFGFKENFISNWNRRVQTPAPDAVARLVEAARAEADKAMRKYPQPNYVISKVAEEAGEVVKAAIHCAEGRETPEAVIGEIKQAMAMLIRLYIEGDQVHGLPPLAAMEASDDRT